MDVRNVLFLLVFLRGTYASGVVSPADVLILLDSSDSFRSTNFELEERFAVQLVRSLFTRENRIGLFTFGDNTHAQFNLNSYNDEQQIVQAINYMWYSTGNGNVEKAINFTLTNGFKESAGDRECVPNLFVVLTHSAISDRAMAQHIGDELRRRSVQTFVLNMGKTKSNNFETMTNSSQRVINIGNFTILANLATELVKQISSDLPSTGCGVLGQWQPWTACSASCGEGLRFRLRECKKSQTTDKDCTAELSEESTCMSKICADPVDGRWADWNSWSVCSKTCNNGVQKRTRACAAPMPLRGGKTCPGANQQRRNCSEWQCPDCQKVCPPGGRLSQDCETCLCTSATLFGQITDTAGLPVDNADIYLESRRYKAIAKTGEMGYFHIDGICLMNEQIFISADLHANKLTSPSPVNSTHWTLNGTVEAYIPPVFAVQPHDKSRMVGQSFTLCCLAVGKPSPSTYVWLKDDTELERIGTNGTLTVSSAATTDSGTYKCVTETPAGVSQSQEAYISISGFANDTCGTPVSKLEQLPAGCFLNGDSTRNGTINVGTCGRAKCMTSSLKDNGTCTDWWPHYCCDSKDVEELNINCDGFSYKTTRIKSCQCQLCIFRTTVSGKATGRNNSKEIPFKLGSIFVNGKAMGKTNMAGFFKFDVPKGIKRVIVTFRDTIFKRFMEVTKIISVTEGEDVFATVVIPLKRKPVPFNTSEGVDIELGGGEDGVPPAASVGFDKDSFLTSDGKPYSGAAKATVHFMDPRNRDSLDTANGDFVSETSDGEMAPLRTYGIVQLAIDDDSGNPLHIHSPVKFSLDASLFNISLDSNGEPDIALWDYDANKGIWVENAKFRFVPSSSGSRKLLQSTNTVQVNSKPRTADIIDPYDYVDRVTGRRVVRTVWVHNYDYRVPIYEDIHTKVPVLKNGVCVVKVSVYTDMTLTETLSTSEKSIEITAYTSETDGPPYIGKDIKNALKKGHACMVSFCDKMVYLSVKSDEEMLMPAKKHILPPYYPIRSVKDNEITFESRDFGDAFDCSKPPCKGPMFPFSKRAECDRGDNDASFHFSFAFFTKPPQMTYTTGSENDYNKKLSWYPVSPEKKTFRSCFFKLLLKIYDSYDVRIIATSFLRNFGGEQFGTHIVGPTPATNLTDYDVRGACLEFRCPGYIKDGSIEDFSAPTAVEIHMQTANASVACKLRVPNANMQNDITPLTSGTKGVTGVRFLSKAGVNYGSSYGVFINDNHKKDVEKFCKYGADRGSHIDGSMNPLKNPAIELDCRV